MAGLSHSFVGTGETWTHRRFSSLVVKPYFLEWQIFVNFLFPSFPHFFRNSNDPYAALSETCLPCLIADPWLAGMRCTVGVNWGVACGRSIHQTRRLNSTPGVCNTSYRLEMSRLKLQCAVSTDIDTVSMQIVSRERACHAGEHRLQMIRDSHHRHSTTTAPQHHNMFSSKINSSLQPRSGASTPAGEYTCPLQSTGTGTRAGES